MDVNRIGQIFDLIKFNKTEKNGKTTDIKDLNEVALFDDKYTMNTSLLDEDKFVDAFVKSGENSFSKQEMKYLYDAVAELDGQYGVSLADLTTLAGMANETDKSDEKGLKINEADIIAFLNKVDAEIENAKNPQKPEAKPEAKPAEPIITEDKETVYDKPAKMEETKTETVDGYKVTTHVKYKEDKVKKEIMEEEKIYETREIVKDVPFEKDSRIKSDKKGKYVTV